MHICAGIVMLQFKNTEKSVATSVQQSGHLHSAFIVECIPLTKSPHKMLVTSQTLKTNQHLVDDFTSGKTYIFFSFREKMRLTRDFSVHLIIWRGCKPMVYLLAQILVMAILNLVPH